MNTPGLFIVGALVTLVVLAAVALLVYGALLDGRDIVEAEETDAARPAPQGGPAAQAG
jgi:hypothetical protein